MNKYTAIALVLSFAVGPANSMEQLSDDLLSEETGQSLFNSNTASNGSLTFFRLLADVEMSMNLNVNKLKLGCDGPNGTGVCDIDVERLRLSGIGSSSAVDSGPATDFVLRRPYLEFAIKNQSTAATREVVGIRLGAASAHGVMSMGENPNLSTPSDDTGLNRFSGDMTATLRNITMNDVRACIGVLVFGNCIGLGNLRGTANIASHTQSFTLNRATQINDIGPMKAVSNDLVFNVTTPLDNSHLLNQSLKTIHEIVIEDPSGQPTKDFYLSLQKETVNWQKLSTGAFDGVPAQKGWWMSIPQVIIQNTTAYDTIQLGAIASLAGLFNFPVNIQGSLDLGQRPVDNCWGTLIFC